MNGSDLHMHANIKTTCIIFTRVLYVGVGVRAFPFVPVKEQPGMSPLVVMDLMETSYGPCATAPCLHWPHPLTRQIYMPLLVGLMKVDLSCEVFTWIMITM